jgi:hypothetical protein
VICSSSGSFVEIMSEFSLLSFRACAKRMSLAVIACDKREAFAQGSSSDEAIHASSWRKMDCLAEPVIGRVFARPAGSQ